MTTTIHDDLLRVIDREVGRAAKYATPPEPLTGGFWAAIYGFELEPDSADAESRFSGPLVLRVMPEAAVATKEIVVQTALAESGVSTPRVVMSGNDPGLGGAFMIMARARGQSPMSGLKIGRSPRALVRSLQRIPLLLAEVAGSLHAVDPRPIDAALRSAGITLAVLGDTSYQKDIVAAADVRSAYGFGELLRWFEHHTPSAPDRVVCHGDLHPFNLLVDDDGAVSVLDWTNANICPRELDIGFTSAFLRCAPIGVPAAVRPILRRVTNRLANRFVASYRSQPGVPMLDEARLRWFEALQYGRCLAEVAIGRTDPTTAIGPSHPFEIAARDMTRELSALTGISVVLPVRT